MSNPDGKLLTDEIKASLLGSGILHNLKDVTYSGEKHPDTNPLDGLRQEAQAVIGEIKQQMNSGILSADSSKQLSQALQILQGALAKKNISASELAAAISDAMTAEVGAGSGDNSVAVQTRIDKLWHKVEADNKDIDDDFGKMQKDGIVFNPGLMGRHKELMEYLQEHPRDIAKQKELDAVDDAMLMQAEPQIAKHPEAKALFDDVKKKSMDRHQLVDKALTALNKEAAITNDDFDKDAPAAVKALNKNLTIDDITPQPVGQKFDSDGKKVVRMQKNVQFRTKSNRKPTLPISHSSRNRLICRLFYNNNYQSFRESDGKFCSKVNVRLLDNSFCLTQRCIQPLRKQNEKSDHVLPGIYRQTS